ncbi:MAG: hypothetical protein KDB86_05120 [Actinobacteria bacterium]|nr:hypothetical protein [Actinomycetota bacterium]MCB9390335.1 hypothetical protein [Acidimicrobiia bacterium]
MESATDESSSDPSGTTGTPPIPDTPAIPDTSGTDPETDQARPPTAVAFRLAVLTFLTAAIPRLLTAGTFVTIDEATWMRRSERFSDALFSLDFASMSASVGGERSTMPGVTTMWLGSIGRFFWGIGKSIGLIDDPYSFQHSYKALAVSEMVVAVATALLVAWLAYLVTRWAGTIAGIAIAILCGFEPFIVGLGAILHVDELSALFGTIALVATCLALGLPKPVDGLSPRKAAVAAGIAMAGALLSKITAVGFMFSAAVLVIYAVVLFLKSDGDVRSTFATFGPVLGFAAGALVVTVLISWPALVVDPGGQISALRTSAKLGSGGYPEFLFGKLGYSRLFYIVNTPLRITPWGALIALVGTAAALVNRRTRTLTLVWLIGLIPMFYMLSTASKRYPRYAIVFLIPIFASSALGLSWRRLRLDRLPRWTAPALVGVTLLYATLVAPYGLAYFNPALGGSKTALETVPVGWGEGINLAGDRIEALAGGSCEGVTTQVGTPRLGENPYGALNWPCLTPASSGRSTYFVYYISELQKSTPLERQLATRGRTYVESVSLRGIDYAEIWVIDPESE